MRALLGLDCILPTTTSSTLVRTVDDCRRLPLISERVLIAGHSKTFGIKMSLLSVWHMEDGDGTAMTVVQLARSLIGHLIAPTTALVSFGAAQSLRL